MEFEYTENNGLLKLVGTTIYDGLCLYKEEIERCGWLNVCYGKNHKSNIQRAIVEYQLYKLGQANTIGVISQEEYTERQTSYFLRLQYSDELILTTFKLRNRTNFPKEAHYRGNYAKTNQLSLFTFMDSDVVVPDGYTYGIICFGIDQEGMFGYIGYPDKENRSWLKVTRLEDYFTYYVEKEQITREVLPKLKIAQVSANGVS